MSQDNLKGFRSYSKARTATPPPSGMPSWAPLMTMAIIAALLGAGFSYTAFNTDGSNDGTTDDDIVLNDDNSDDDLYEPPVDNIETDETELSGEEEKLITEMAGEFTVAESTVVKADESMAIEDGGYETEITYAETQLDEVDLEQLSGEPADTAGEPEVEEYLEEEYDNEIGMEPGDLTEPHFGPSTSENVDGMMDSFDSSFNGFDYVEGYIGWGRAYSVLDKDYGHDFEDFFFADSSEGRGNLFSNDVITTTTTYDNDTDGNPEFVRKYGEGSGRSGNEDVPGFVNRYYSDYKVFDYDSDGNKDYLQIDEHGFEANGRDGNGTPRFVSVHVRYVRAWDNDSDGNPEHVIAYEGDYVRVDNNRNGVPEYEAGRFSDMEMWDNNSDGNFETFHSGERAFKRMDKNEDGNNELRAARSESTHIADTNSDGAPELITRAKRGSAVSDRNDDGNPEVTIVSVESRNVAKPESSMHFKTATVTKRFALRYVEGTSIVTSKYDLNMLDNNTDGNIDATTLESWKYVGRDRDSDGNKNFQAMEKKSFVMYDNMSIGRPSFIKVVKVQGWAWDHDDDGERDNGRLIITIFVYKDDDQDGDPEVRFYRRWDSNDQ